MATTSSGVDASSPGTSTEGLSHSIPPPTPAPVDSAFGSSIDDDESDGEFHDVADDVDARFSLIPLQTPTTPRANPLADSSSGSSDASTNPKRASNSSSIIAQKSPRASGSPSTRRTTLPSEETVLGKHDSGMSALMARQKERLDADPKAHRASLQGGPILKQEFDKLQQSSISYETEVDWDFWGTVIADYEDAARTQSERLAKAIEQGIPDALRGHIWQLMCDRWLFKDLNLPQIQLNSVPISRSASKDPDLEQQYSNLIKETSPYEKAIMRDLGRTFPHHAFFMEGKGIGQENLFNVLKAYSLYDSEVGYCQGLAFIVAVLLLNMPDEEAFCVFVRLMHAYNLRTIYLPEMPGLQLRLYQFDRLVEELLPVLYVHFLRQGVKSSMYCSQWFLTMFSYRFPLPIVFRIFDHLLATGVEAIFGFAIVLLQTNEQQLLKLKFDSILDYLKSALFDAFLDASQSLALDNSKTESDSPGSHLYQANRFVQEALSVRITPFQLDNYASEWEEMRRAQTAHAVEMDNLRSANRALMTQVKQLEGSLAQMNEDHVEIVKQLVMMKVEKEDLEVELVKYKMLYAESMQAHSEESAGNARLSTISRLSSWSSLGRR